MKCLLGLWTLTLSMLMVVVVVQGDKDDDDGGLHWAVLVAGSNTYNNYRHQADICHAYHIVSKNGIPDERIIVMMYDDIAYNPENPFPGNIINQPNGTNVYPGVPKDYTKHEVRPDVFLKVLTGDDQGVEKILGRKGKVLKSGPKDRVFINFADHGSAGALHFPSQMLFSDDFHKAVLEMYEKKMYKQLVFYVEACESGSMFFNFTQLPHINAFATTAANPDEPSHGCYYDEKRQAYLGDEYSVNWMQDSDKENLKQETLATQFKIVKEKTAESHVSEYGDLEISKLPVADFIGSLNSNSKPLFFTPRATAPDPRADAVPADMVEIEVLNRKISQTRGQQQQRHRVELARLLQKKKSTEEFFRSVVGEVIEESLFDYFVQRPLQLANYACYKQSVQLVVKKCPGMNITQNYFAARKLRVLANLCDTNISAHRILEAISQVAARMQLCV